MNKVQYAVFGKLNLQEPRLDGPTGNVCASYARSHWSNLELAKSHSSL